MHSLTLDPYVPSEESLHNKATSIVLQLGNLDKSSLGNLRSWDVLNPTETGSQNNNNNNCNGDQAIWFLW